MARKSRFATEEERQAHRRAYMLEYNKRYNAAHKEEIREAKRRSYQAHKHPETERTCTECGRTLPVDAFNTSTGKRTHASVCLECRQAKAKAKAKLTEEERRAKRLAWRRAHEKAKREQAEAERAEKAAIAKARARELAMQIKHLNIDPNPEPIIVHRKPKVKPERKGCMSCLNWNNGKGCFEGFENTETDFARCGCHHYHRV